MQSQLKQVCLPEPGDKAVKGWINSAQRLMGSSTEQLRLHVAHMFPIECNSPLVSVIYLYMQ